MIRREPFSLTLTSNGSAGRFTSNTTSKFSNVLPQRVVLQGEWEVALTKIRYPGSFYNVSKGSNHLKGTLARKLSNGNWMKVGFRYEIPETTLTDGVALLSELNRIIKKETHLEDSFFKYHSKTGFASINEKLTWRYHDAKRAKPMPAHRDAKPKKEEAEEGPSNDAAEEKAFLEANAAEAADQPKVDKVPSTLIVELILSPDLSRQLGYEPGTDVVKLDHSPLPVNPYVTFPYEVFVYCNLIEPQMVSDTFAQIIESTLVEIDVDHKHLAMEKTFFPLNWVPLLVHDFQIVQIDLRQGSGDLLPFQDGFSSAVVLSFRPKNSKQ